MGDRRAAALGSPAFGAASIESEPVGPVSTELEEVVEVNETGGLEIIDKLRQHIFRGQGPENDQPILNAEFLISEIVTLVEAQAREANTLERALTDENHGSTDGELQGHELCSIRD